MPRFYFHVADSVESIDPDCVELADTDAARAMAVIYAGEALRDLDPKFWSSPEWRTWVTDQSGASVCALSFAAEGTGPASEES